MLNRKIMDNFMERLLNEQSELNERLEKLKAFQTTENFLKLDAVQQSLLNIQSNPMATYSQVLAERISWLQK
jgi:hypothetical protein